MNILVAGATGNTGKKIVKKLENMGQTPVAMVRNSSDDHNFPQNTQILRADLEEDLTGKLDNIDAVIFAAGSGSGTSEEKTIAVDQEGAKKLVDEAKNQGIRRFVMLSSKGAESPKDAKEEMQHYLQAKRNADDYLIDSGLEFTIVRPVSLTDDEGIGKVNVSHHVDASTEIAREDVADFLVESLFEEAMSGEVVELTTGETPIKQAVVFQTEHLG
ncbi:MAG: SDR family oxidoreductase [Cyclobacteriaceae bacterium]